MVNREESLLWDKFMKNIEFYNVKYPTEKLSRLFHIINVYKSLCKTCKEICDILQDLQSIKYTINKKKTFID